MKQRENSSGLVYSKQGEERILQCILNKEKGSCPTFLQVIYAQFFETKELVLTLAKEREKGICFFVNIGALSLTVKYCNQLQWPIMHI